MADQYPKLVPHLVVNGAIAAIEFYGKAFGAQELMRVPAEDGKRLMHASLAINGAQVYLVDDFVEYREQCGRGRVIAPKEAGATGVMIHLDVPDCDAAVKRAVEAGAAILMEPWDAFWGDRYGQVIDPFGHVWSFANRLPGKAA
jgi:PhnB protein